MCALFVLFYHESRAMRFSFRNVAMFGDSSRRASDCNEDVMYNEARLDELKFKLRRLLRKTSLWPDLCRSVWYFGLHGEDQNFVVVTRLYFSTDERMKSGTSGFCMAVGSRECHEFRQPWRVQTYLTDMLIKLSLASQQKRLSESVPIWSEGHDKTRCTYSRLKKTTRNQGKGKGFWKPATANVWKHIINTNNRYQPSV